MDGGIIERADKESTPSAWSHPPTPSGTTAHDSLLKALTFLWKEHAGFDKDNDEDMDVGEQFDVVSGAPSSWEQFSLLKQLLTVRPADPPLPEEITECIDRVLMYRLSKSEITESSAVPSFTILDSNMKTKLSLWKGDITRLAGVTAIVNAANAALLGCFRPNHPCIDNAIHVSAGPRLREDCNNLMETQGDEEPVGQAKVTSGYCLPARHVIHTVGPRVPYRSQPSEEDRLELRNCYISCLQAAESLPPFDDGHKAIAFCCISTGMFAFPSEIATEIAVDTVVDWLRDHSSTTITHVIFNVFMPRNLELYAQKLGSLIPGIVDAPPPSPSNQLFEHNLSVAQTWLAGAKYLIISAGAGLSASAGLDYSSTDLLVQKFAAGFREIGINRLYDAIGFNRWPSEGAKWGYYATLLDVIRQWPKSQAYKDVLDIATSSVGAGNYFVRTTNADGFFVKNDFPVNVIATPQGQYKYLQCLRVCRPDAVFPSDAFLDAALPYLDPRTGFLIDASKIPKCSFCGGDVFICVRAGNWFNPSAFLDGERAWKDFLRGSRAQDSNTVILEVGVGLNTPGVLRYPDENMTRRSGGKVKLIRIGLEEAGWAPWDL